jgi:glutamate-ammonia-ligase adenylyltransferase
LRLFQRRELVNVGLLDLAEKISGAEVETALTEVAEVCLEEALALATRQLTRTSPEAAREVETGRFLVVGMGKLGSRELTYGSDLDVIFLFDVEGTDEQGILEAQAPFVRLSQKLGWALQTPTAEGVCYEVDARVSATRWTPASVPRGTRAFWSPLCALSRGTTPSTPRSGSTRPCCARVP